MAGLSFSFAALLDRPDIWRGDSLSRAGTPTVPCGFPGLDAELPGGGCPPGALTEILPAHEGIGELRLLGPALAGLSKRGLRLAWIAAPPPPHGPALAAAGTRCAASRALRAGARRGGNRCREPRHCAHCLAERNAVGGRAGACLERLRRGAR